VLVHLLRQALRDVALAQEMPAGLGGDRETGRHRQAKVGHFRQVRAFAPEQVLEILVALGEVVDELPHCTLSLYPCRRPPDAKMVTGRSSPWPFGPQSGLYRE
jgi:hypothetical protein